jgi:hypothetical protein
MARPKSERILGLKQKLIARLSGGFYRPGQRFFSNRALATHFGVSYLTAHRLMRELESEGWLQRRRVSGTYVHGAGKVPRKALLLFHRRAQTSGSFGGRLLDLLSLHLRDASIPFDVRLLGPGESRPAIGADVFPVIWDCQGYVLPLALEHRFLLVLNSRAPRGLIAGFVDSVSIDDFSGGVAAAEILRRYRKLAVLAGPSADPRSKQRVEGFRSIAIGSRVLSAETWYAEEAGTVAARVARRQFDGVFCCNDRLAQALGAACERLKIRRPATVGFDDAPIAEQLDLTTVGIPWEDFTAGAAEVIRDRLEGRGRSAVERIYPPHVVFRASAVLRRQGRQRLTARSSHLAANP